MGLKAGYHVYATKQWKRLRFHALRRDGFRCVKCGDRHALEVDHIQAIRTRPERAFDLTNLQTLCRSCHSKKTSDEKGLRPIPGRAEWKNLLSKGNLDVGKCENFPPAV